LQSQLVASKKIRVLNCKVIIHPCVLKYLAVESKDIVEVATQEGISLLTFLLGEAKADMEESLHRGTELCDYIPIAHHEVQQGEMCDGGRCGNKAPRSGWRGQQHRVGAQLDERLLTVRDAASWPLLALATVVLWL
jgi:hypothetical protein